MAPEARMEVAGDWEHVVSVNDDHEAWASFAMLELTFSFFKDEFVARSNRTSVLSSETSSLNCFNFFRKLLQVPKLTGIFAQLISCVFSYVLLLREVNGLKVNQC